MDYVARIPSGVTDQYVYFMAYDVDDYVSLLTGLTSWTVYRSRNGAAASAFTTPTVNETDSSNMPGVYELLLDEDMTIDSGDDSQMMVFRITSSGMVPRTIAIELYRSKITAGETLSVSTGICSANAVQISGDSTAADNAELFFDGTGYAGGTTKLQVDAVAISGDTTAADNAELFFDGTGYAGGTTKLQVDAVAISGDTTAADNAELFFDGTGYAGGTTKLQVDAVAISGDTTAADNAELFFDGTGYNAANSTIGTITTVTALTANRAEPGTATPSASTSALSKLDYVYKSWRNRSTQTSATYSLCNDGSTTVGQSATVSDDGTTFTRGEVS